MCQAHTLHGSYSPQSQGFKHQQLGLQDNSSAAAMAAAAAAATCYCCCYCSM
jgi:hypothetical protein